MKNEQPRKPAGTPTGGQWSGTEGADAGVDLSADGRTATLMDDEAKARAVVSDGSFEPTRAQDWWDQQYALAEHDPHHPVPKIGEFAGDGPRVYRRTYEVGGGRVQMPARSAVNAFADQHDGEAFDIPVTVDTPAGARSGWVRAARGENGLWATRALGYDSERTADGVAEAVASALEGRQPGPSPRNFAELIAKRHQRDQQAGILTHKVQSSWIESFGYSDDDGLMTMSTLRGDVYAYEVDRDIFDFAVHSYSPGRVFNAYLKGNQRAEVERCNGCGRFTVNAATHVCPLPTAAEIGAVDTDAEKDRRRRALDAVRKHGEPTRSAADTSRHLMTLRSAYDRSTGHLDGLTGPFAKDLAHSVPEETLNGRVGASPTVGELLTVASAHEGVKVGGSADPDDLSSVRLSRVVLPESKDMSPRDVLFAARDGYGIHSALRQPRSVAYDEREGGWVLDWSE